MWGSGGLDFYFLRNLMKWTRFSSSISPWSVFQLSKVKSLSLSMSGRLGSWFIDLTFNMRRQKPPSPPLFLSKVNSVLQEVLMLEFIYWNYKMQRSTELLGWPYYFFISFSGFISHWLASPLIVFCRSSFEGRDRAGCRFDRRSVWVCDLGCVRSRTWPGRERSCQFVCFQYAVTFAWFKFFSSAIVTLPVFWLDVTHSCPSTWQMDLSVFLIDSLIHALAKVEA